MLVPLPVILCCSLLFFVILCFSSTGDNLDSSSDELFDEMQEDSQLDGDLPMEHQPVDFTQELAMMQSNIACNTFPPQGSGVQFPYFIYHCFTGSGVASQKHRSGVEGEGGEATGS